MLHPQVLSNNVFLVGLPVKIFEALLSSSILPTCPAHFNLLDLFTLTTLDERYELMNHEVLHCEAFSTPHFHPFWAQILALGSCFQIPLACIPPLIQETTFHNHIAQLAIYYIF